MKPIVLVILAGALLLMLSCKREKKNEDVTTEVNKSGSVESSVTVEHAADSLHDILVTTHKVWNHNNVFKTIEYRDTIPALGTEITSAENADGDTKTVAVKKDYEIFITVK